MISIYKFLSLFFSFVHRCQDIYANLRVDFERVQHAYSEALDRISALQIELEIQNGQSRCAADSTTMGGGGSSETELSALKEKLIKKTQLLEKAKILLSRAAAKEKNFRDQVPTILFLRSCDSLK